MNLSAFGLAAAAISAALVSAPAGWFAYDLIAKPGVIREERVRCDAIVKGVEEEVRRVTAEALAAEQLRRFRAGELATEQFIKESQAAADDAQAVRDVLELEIEQYVQRIREQGDDDDATGKVRCSIDAVDLDLLGVQRPEPAGAGER